MDYRYVIKRTSDLIEKYLVFLHIRRTMDIISTSDTSMSERRLPTTNKPLAERYGGRDVSFMERWQLYREEKKRTGQFSRTNKYIMRAVVLFQIPTMIYVYLAHILPYYFMDSDPFTLYYIKVLFTYSCVMILANWFAAILVDTSYEKTRDSPYLRMSHSDQPVERFSGRIQESMLNNNKKNTHCELDMTSQDEGLPWHYCEKCEMNVPYRVQHCNVCKKCIRKRDHHCFIIGTCLGFKNERYFIVLVFHTAITGIISFWVTMCYIHSVIWSDLDSVFDLVLPVNIIRYLCGYMNGFNCLLITHVYIEFLFGIMCLGYFTQEVNLNIKGKTLYEHKKNLPVRNRNTFSQNMKSVFGEFWVLNFIFPMTVVFRQRDDGTTWDSVKISNHPVMDSNKGT